MVKVAYALCVLSASYSGQRPYCRIASIPTWSSSTGGVCVIGAAERVAKSIVCMASKSTSQDNSVKLGTGWAESCRWIVMNMNPVILANLSVGNIVSPLQHMFKPSQKPHCWSKQPLARRSFWDEQSLKNPTPMRHLYALKGGNVLLESTWYSFFINFPSKKQAEQSRHEDSELKEFQQKTWQRAAKSTRHEPVTQIHASQRKLPKHAISKPVVTIPWTCQKMPGRFQRLGRFMSIYVDFTVMFLQFWKHAK